MIPVFSGIGRVISDIQSRQLRITSTPAVFTAKICEFQHNLFSVIQSQRCTKRMGHGIDG